MPRVRSTATMDTVDVPAAEPPPRSRPSYVDARTSLPAPPPLQHRPSYVDTNALGDRSHKLRCTSLWMLNTAFRSQLLSSTNTEYSGCL